MKYRFDNEPDEMDLASMFRALAVLADREKIVASVLVGDDMPFGACEFTGCLGTFYEERWVRQLIKHYSTKTQTYDRDEKAVDALMSMFSQYCGATLTTANGRQMFDHECMSAGEKAADVLLAHKKISIDQLVRP